MSASFSHETRVIDGLKQIDTTAPVDRIIQQVRTMLHEGVLKPGDRLPSEKRIEEQTGIKRGDISRAFRYLESYGILKTVPQSGTYVNAIGFDALQGLMSNIITLESHHLESLMEVRYVLDAYAVELACRNASDEELEELVQVHDDVSQKIESERVSFDEDLVFHLKIAELSKNPALKSFISLLTSQAISLFKEVEHTIGREKVTERLRNAKHEHQRILDAILQRDELKARKAITEHYEISRKFRRQFYPSRGDFPTNTALTSAWTNSKDTPDKSS